jgi:hypothetical protein
VRNEDECICSVCVCSAHNCCDTVISGEIIKEMPGSVASGTNCVKKFRDKVLWGWHLIAITASGRLMSRDKGNSFSIKGE